MPKGSANCGVCKNILRVVMNTAKAQGECDWYAEHTECPKKRRKLVTAYQTKYPEPDESKRRKPLCMLTLKHEVEAETAADKNEAWRNDVNRTCNSPLS